MFEKVQGIARRYEELSEKLCDPTVTSSPERFTMDNSVPVPLEIGTDGTFFLGILSSFGGRGQTRKGGQMLLLQHFDLFTDQQMTHLRYRLV